MASPFTPIITTPIAVCTACKKPQSDLPEPLKRCGKCKSVLYCSRECQVGDWAVHKGSCKKDETASRIDGSTEKTDPVPVDPLVNLLSTLNLSDPALHNASSSSANDYISTLRPQSFASTGLGSFASDSSPNAHLSSLPRKMAFRHLIDAFRLRCEDEYTFGGGNTVGLYNGEDPNHEFGRYLNKAQSKGVLPGWWNKQTRKECGRIANDMNGDSCIHHAVEKSDIYELYPGDSFMPMKLRVLAEKVYGRGVSMW